MDKYELKELIDVEKQRIKELPAESAEAKEDTDTVPTISLSDYPVVPSANKVDADEVINSAFNSALIEKIDRSDALKENLMNSAERVIKNKVGKIDSEAELESKAAYFNNKRDACDCFGYTEKTTEKWAVNAMNFWHNVMTAIWIFIGCFTFAPITFVAKKITVIFKKTWVAVLLAVIIYLLVIFVPIIVAYIPK